MASEVSEEVAAWLGDPVTRQFVKDMERQCEQASIALFSAASNSSDPDVRAAYSHYQSVLWVRRSISEGRVK